MRVKSRLRLVAAGDAVLVGEVQRVTGDQLLIDTEALTRVVLSASLRVRPASSTTAEPCSVKPTVAPAVTTGASLTAVTFTVLVAAALSRAPSLAVQVIVAAGTCAPKLVGLLWLTTKVTERRTAW